MKRQYHAYLIRLWTEGDDSAEWRIVLENAQTRERRTFADLSAAVDFLETQLTRSATCDPSPSSS